MVLAIEQVARVCGVTGRLLVDSNLGPVGAIVHLGTEAQKQKYLPRVVRGDKPAIAITEHGAGSAASELETRAERDGDAWVLTGTKRWITGAGVSQTYVVLCRFDGIPGLGRDRRADRRGRHPGPGRHAARAGDGDARDPRGRGRLRPLPRPR